MNRLLVFFFFFITYTSFSQSEIEKRQIVLKKGIINKIISFGKWNEKGDDELNLTYLGIIRSESSSYKIMTSLWIWGISRRATSRILIYVLSNKFLGEFCLTMSYELPKDIRNNKLYFDLLDDDCKRETYISFENGIPEYLILNCKNSNYLVSTFFKD
jgi:hypothetical protein